MECSIDDCFVVDQLYDYPVDFRRVHAEGIINGTAKVMYEFLIQDLISKNGSLIPSRNEKRSDFVKWRLAWKNWSKMKGLTAEEKCFAWKVQQDMLPIGSRIHRNNAERRCLFVLENGQSCQDVQTIEHLFLSCESVGNVYDNLSLILNVYLERAVQYTDIVHFSFNHRNKKKLNCALWFAVKVMFKVFHNKSRNRAQILREIVKEIDWNIRMNRKLGSLGEILFLKEQIENRI